MFRIVLFSVFNFILFITNAQQLPEAWVRIFKAQGLQSDRVAAITTDASGDIYVAGYASNYNGGPDAFVMKRNPAGTMHKPLL
jgi:hypothetical protein